MRKINEIIIHCSDTQEGCDVTAEDIRRWHTTPKEKGGRGWRDIGYHYVIRLDGVIEKGRPDTAVGAHCADHNPHSIGICYVGGRHIREDGSWEWGDTRTREQKGSLLALVTALLTFYGLKPDCIHGHYEFSKKACPCFDVRRWVAEEVVPCYEGSLPAKNKNLQKVINEK